MGIPLCQYTLLQKKRNFLKVAFLLERLQISDHVVIFFILVVLPVHDPGLLTLTWGHQEKLIQKSCVSFEEECTCSASFVETLLHRVQIEN